MASGTGWAGSQVPEASLVPRVMWEPAVWEQRTGGPTCPSAPAPAGIVQRPQPQMCLRPTAQGGELPPLAFPSLVLLAEVAPHLLPVLTSQS